jgi:diadenosine tetraphosphate (Ap4A) HIT family hydrolase
LAVIDNYAISPGHTLVVPHRHVESIFNLEPDERQSLWRLVEDARQLLSQRHNPSAFNIGVNDGKAAGQTIGHAHIHVIPRYVGDVEDPRGGVRWILPQKAKYW